MSNCNCGCEQTSTGNNIPHDPHSIMEYMRRQELLSTIEEKTDKDINIHPCTLPEGGEKKEITLGLGEQIVLKAGNDGSILPYIWENSNPEVILLQPTQYLDQGHVMAISLGEAIIRATCANCSEKFYTWNLKVVEELQRGDGGVTVVPGEPGSGEDNWEVCPCPECGDDCSCKGEGEFNPEETKDEILGGGSIILSPNSDTTLDLGREELVLDGVSLDLTVGEKMTISGKGSVIVAGEGSVLKLGGYGEIIGGNGDDGRVITAEKGSTVEITGCSFTATDDALGTGTTCIYSSGGKIKISGGTFKCTSPYNGVYSVLSIDESLLTPGTPLTKYIEVTGGTFYNQDPELGILSHPEAGTFLPEGYMSTPSKDSNGNQIFLVHAEDEWPEEPTPEEPKEKTPEEYAQEVTEGLMAGGEVNITLTQNYLPTEVIIPVKGTNLTLDLGEKTITQMTGKDFIDLTKGVNATLKNGTIIESLPEKDMSEGAIYLSGATKDTLTLENMNIMSARCVYLNNASDEVTILSGRYQVLYSTTPAVYVAASSSATDSGKATILGGVFGTPGINNKYLLNVQDKLLKGTKLPKDYIEVRGGDFYNFNPAESHSENPVANFVADDYMVGYWEEGEDKIYRVKKYDPKNFTDAEITDDDKVIYWKKPVNIVEIDADKEDKDPGEEKKLDLEI